MELTFTAYCRTDDRWDMARPHFHSELELLFPLTDGEDIFIDNVSYPLRRGTLFYLAAGVPHRSRARREGSYHRCVLRLPVETVRGLGAALPEGLQTGRGCCAVLSEAEFALCSRLFQRLLSESADAADRLRCTAALAELLALVTEKWSDPALLLPPPAAGDGVMAAVVDYIRSHLTADLSLESLSQRFYLSKSALCHRFKAATGFTVTEYVILCRVRHAGVLLRRGLSVRSAGEAAGFGDNAHFIRTFRRVTGMTPGRYAKEQKV